MKTQKSRQGAWERSVLAAAAGLCLAGVVWAQSVEGSVFGRAGPQAEVTLTNLDTGIERKVQTDQNGGFNFTRMPPGHYQLASAGVVVKTWVSMGEGTQVDLTQVGQQEVLVYGERGRVRLKMNSAESNSDYTQEQLRAVPVARSPEAVALLAPGVVRGDAGLGKGGLPSFGGASVAENGYYINGFDVTNIRNFLSYAELPFDAIAQEQVKTGGYGAEYGRSLGGVVSLATKSGTKEWKGGVELSWEPAALRAAGRDVRNRNIGKENTYTVYESRDTQDLRSAVVYLGGPLIPDKLFVFGLVEGREDTTKNYDYSTNVRTRSAEPTGLIKLDWVLSEGHRLEFTGISNKRKLRYTDYNNARDYSSSFDGAGEVSYQQSGGTVSILKYTGALTDDLTLSLMGGRVTHVADKLTGSRARSNCPVVYDVDDSKLGCWPGVWPGPIVLDPNAEDDTDKRRAWRMDLDYRVGDHQLRGGVDNQVFRSAAAGTTYFAGAYYQYLVSQDGSINHVPDVVAPGTEYIFKYVKQTTSGVYEVQNKAFYIEDTWQITPRLMLYGGLRSESFDNRNADGVSFVKANSQIAPRTGFALDVLGDSSLKIFGTAGRYFIPVASNTNIRMTHGEYEAISFHTYTQRDPVTQVPLGLSDAIGGVGVALDGRLPDPATVASTSLKPMYQDEYVLGFKQALTPKWGFGVKGTYRTVRNGMDDFCAYYPMVNWAKDYGYNNFSTDSLSGCILMNPGKGVRLKMDVNNDGQLKEVSIPASYFDLAPYTRTYRAMEFTLERPFDGKWGLQTSYTWSRNVGTAEGYVQSNLDQKDAGITQDFDSASFTRGANGYLPNDRRHVFKFLGNYAVSDAIQLGLQATIASGRPISCLGFVPTTAPDYEEVAGYTTASSYYCVNSQGESVLHPRGSMGRTPWTSQFDLHLAYLTALDQGRMTLAIDIFNIFNQQMTTEVNETGDLSRDTTQRNLSYGTPTSFTAPRHVRLTARYEF